MKKRFFSLLLALFMVTLMLPFGAISQAYAESTFINKIEINDFNPALTDAMTGKEAKSSITYSYPADSKCIKGNNNKYIYQNGQSIYEDKLVAGVPTSLKIEVYAKPFGCNVENPDYDFDGSDLSSIEVYINGEKRTDVKVTNYNSSWRCVDLYIPVTVSEYTVEKYTVTFDSNGGSAVASQQVADGSHATEPMTPAKTGYTFEGWYSDEGLTNPFDFDTAITSNITLYAKWTKNAPIELAELSATITLPTDGASPVFSGTSGDSTKYYVYQVVFYDGTTEMTETDTFEAGKTYKIRISFRPTTSDYTIPVSASVKINGLAASFYTSIADYYGTKIFSMNYTVPLASINYTVSFDANGGTGSMGYVTQEKNTSYVLPVCTFTAPSGKQFKCWSVGGVEKNVGDVITITADTTIKAMWKEVHTHTLTLVSAKAASCTSNGNSAYYTCSCGKWFKDSSGNVEIVDHSSVVISAYGHSYFAYWSKDATNHWHECSTCGAKKDITAHIWNAESATGNNDKHCTVCGFVAQAKLLKIEVTEGPDVKKLASGNVAVSSDMTIARLLSALSSGVTILDGATKPYTGMKAVLKSEGKVVDSVTIVVRGDVDGKDGITAADARLALRKSVGLESFTGEYLEAADVDGDGKITAADARLILRASVGLEKKLSA